MSLWNNRRVNMKISNYMARQYSNPSGIFGRFVMGAVLNRSNSRSNALVLSMMVVAPNDTVLEVGFGGGELLFKIATHFRCKAIVGVERSDEMVRRATRKAARIGKKQTVKLYKGVSDALPFPDRSFDHVCSVNTVYFWAELSKNLTEIYRVLRDGGDVLLGFGDALVLQNQGYAEKGFVLYTPDQVRASLIRCGFEIMEERCMQRAKRGNFHVFRYKKPELNKRLGNE